MKNTKITRIALLVLSAALILGTVIGFTVGAEAPEYEIIAKNVIYGDQIRVVFAVDATTEAANAGDVKVAYKWGEDGEIKNAILLDTTDADNLYNGHPSFAINGVPAKELATVVYATAYTGDAPAEDAEWITYSAAEYFYAKLYKDGFINKTEADGKDYNRKLMYEAQLQLSANAQVVLNYNADKPVDKYSYVYTTSELVNFNGANAVFGYGELNVTATVVGEGTLVGWTLTAVDGAETALESVILTATGIYKAEPVFGVHECVDVDPADHVCDSCGETVSLCASKDNNHLCDLCGKVASKCVDAKTDDANPDGKCDVCGAYTFSLDRIDSGNVIDIYNVTMKDTSNIDERNYVDNSTDRTYTKAAFLSLAADPLDATNQVLKISSTHVGSAKLSTITFTPEELVAGGDVYVIEADMTMLGDCVNTGRPYIEVIAVNESGAIIKNPTVLYTSSSKVNGYVSSFKLSGITSTDETHYLQSGTWGKIKYVFCGGSYKTYYSHDNGETWVAAASNTYAGTISKLGFRFNVYNCTGTTLVDNVKCYKTDSVKLNIGGAITEVFPAN